jgi:ribonucleoside-diphosphate reductase alpha chain
MECKTCNLSDISLDNWKSKYRYNKEEFLDTWKRVAKNLADVEPKDKDFWYDKFLNVILKFEKDIPIGLKCVPGGRITANIGTDYSGATLLNCFIAGPVTNASIKYKRKSEDGSIEYPVEIKSESTPDNLVNIFLTILEQAKTLASEGGYGINFDFIRPRGSIINGLGIKHPGVVSYMQIWDSVSECIVKGDNDGYQDKLKNYMSIEQSNEIKKSMKEMIRKGALMGCLSVSHPDIEEFVKAKQTAGKLTKFNLSVLVDNKFLKAVENDDFYELTFNDKVYKKIKAKELYDLIMESNYHRAEPGILFQDNMQKNNPLAYLGKVNSVNPCVRKGSIVTTETGLDYVENITLKDKIQTTLSFDCPEKIEVHEKKPVYRVTFSDGSFQEVTQAHVYHSQQKGKESRKRWKTDKTLSQLEIGDYVRKEPYRFITNNNLDLDRNIGLFAGLYLGKGHVNVHGAVEISCNKEENNSYISNLCDKFNFPWHTDETSNDNSMKIIVGKKASELLIKLGLDVTKLSYDKEFPLWWINTNREFLRGVLDGLISSDGNVNLTSKYPQIRIYSTSYKLHSMINHIMLLFNAEYKIYKCSNKGEKNKILGREVERKHDCYSGVIDNDSIKGIYNELKFLSHENKNIKFKTIIRYTCLNGVKWKVKIKNIEYIGEDTVYDIYEPNADDWNTSGIVNMGCGEIPGLTSLTTVCLLGSINLTQYVSMNREFDFKLYEEDLNTFTRMLDNVIDIAKNPLESYDWIMKNTRQIGMGINGLGSTLLMLGIKYNSKEAIDFTKKICKLKENITWQTSALLAKEKGTFPIYNKHKFQNTDYFKSNRITDETKDLIIKYGTRNGKTTTNPPLGSSSILCDNISNGIEPIFNLEYERKVMVSKWPEGLTQDNVKTKLTEYKGNGFVYWRGKYENKEYYFEPHNRGLCEVSTIQDYGYKWIMNNFPKDKTANYMITTKDLTVDDHLNILEVVQFYNNQSISKTVNVPKNYSYKEFKTLYLSAWKKGLNGLTTYRDGSMESVLSNIEIAEENNDIIKEDIKLPKEFINGPTRIIVKEGMKFYIHFSYLPEDKNMKLPIVLWIYTNSNGEAIVCNRAAKILMELALKFRLKEKIVLDTYEKSKHDLPHNKLGKLISLCLRHNIPRKEIYSALSNIEGDNISSLLTAVRKFILDTLDDGTKFDNMICPNKKCNSKNMVKESGCMKCLDCGYSGCG